MFDHSLQMNNNPMSDEKKKRIYRGERRSYLSNENIVMLVIDKENTIERGTKFSFFRSY